MDTARLYLADRDATRTADGEAVFSPATTGRRLAAIAAAHHDAGHPSPTRDPAVGAVLTGIKRTRAHSTHQMRPLLLDDLRTVLADMARLAQILDPVAYDLSSVTGPTSAIRQVCDLR